MNMVERFFRNITVYMRDGSFASVGKLERQRSWRYAMLSRPGTFGTQRERIF
jgi:hypothetical protein